MSLRADICAVSCAIVLHACTGQLDGAEEAEGAHATSPPFENGDASAIPDGPDAGADGEAGPVAPAPPRPEGSVGSCWGEDRFDDACGREQAETQYLTAMFPGEQVAALVSATGLDGAVVIIWAPVQEAATSRGLSETAIVNRPGSVGHGLHSAISLRVPAQDNPWTQIVHSNRASTSASWQDAWQDVAPQLLVDPPFASAYYEMPDGTTLNWQARPDGDGVQAEVSIAAGGVTSVHTVMVDAEGRMTFRFAQRQGGQVVENWTSADGRMWQPAEGERLDLEFQSELQGWRFDLPVPWRQNGLELVAAHGLWGSEMRWLEGNLSGLSFRFGNGKWLVSDLWVNVETATVAALSLVDGNGNEWSVTDGRARAGREFPQTYQEGVTAQVNVMFDDVELIRAAVEDEEGQLRLVVEDRLPLGQESNELRTAWRWEVLFDSYWGLATGEAAAERTTIDDDEQVCDRQITYDYGATWAHEACAH